MTKEEIRFLAGLCAPLSKHYANQVLIPTTPLPSAGKRNTPKGVSPRDCPYCGKGKPIEDAPSLWSCMSIKEPDNHCTKSAPPVYAVYMCKHCASGWCKKCYYKQFTSMKSSGNWVPVHPVAGPGHPAMLPVPKNPLPGLLELLRDMGDASHQEENKAPKSCSCDMNDILMRGVALNKGLCTMCGGV